MFQLMILLMSFLREKCLSLVIGKKKESEFVGVGKELFCSLHLLFLANFTTIKIISLSLVF